MARMLSLYFKINGDDRSQHLADTVANGFGYETWKALQEAGTVYEARITSLRHPDKPELYSHILLATTYDGSPRPYQQFFWNRITLFFVLVAFAAADSPPFSENDLDQAQKIALGNAVAALEATKGAKTEAEFDRAQTKFREANTALANEMSRNSSLFERFVEWVNANDLTYEVGDPSVEPKIEAVDFRKPPRLQTDAEGKVTKVSRNFLNPAIKPGPFPAN